MRLLLIEDEVDLANALARDLRRQGYSVDTAVEGGEGLGLAGIEPYDLVILDLNLPDMDGIDVLKQLRASQPEILVLVLTARWHPQQRVHGLDEGADDYLVKPFHLEELHARVRALLRRDIRARQPKLSCGDILLDPATRSAWLGEKPLHLTRREFSLLEYLMRKPGEVASQEEMVKHVWGSEIDAFTNTVRVHILSLRRKLGDDPNNPTYIETALGEGYRLKQRDAEGS